MKKITRPLRLIGVLLTISLLIFGFSDVYGQKKAVKKVSEDLASTGQMMLKTTTASPLLEKIDLSLKGPDISMVFIDAISNGDTDQLLKELSDLGLKNAMVYGNKINGYLPVNAVADLESVESLVYAGPVYKPLLNSGPAYTNGDIALRSDVIRSTRGLDGTGKKIGVLSDSYNSLEGASEGVMNGELPGANNPNGYLSDVQVLEDITGGSDEGRAICEILHDIAPASELAFNTAYLGNAGFAQGIINLAEAGCDIITDDITYFNEPFFQDGIITQAVDEVVKKYGIAYYSSAGNYDRDSYSSFFRNAGTYTIANPYGGYILGEYAMHDFDPGPGIDMFQEIVFAPGDDFTCSFQWADPFASVCEGCPGALSDLDIFLTLSEDTADVIIESINYNIDGDAVEVLGASYSGTDTLIAYIAFGRWLGAPGDNPDPRNVKYINFGTALPGEYITNSPTTMGHSNAKHGVSVGASAWFYTPEFGTDPAEINYFSSVGGIPILFNTKGKRLRRPQVRMNPLFTATDGGNTSFFGSTLNDGDDFLNFFGTSASAPHAAAVSAQLQQMAAGRLRTKDIDHILSYTALDMDDPFTPWFDRGYDRKTGYGLIQADKAANELLKRVGIMWLIPYAECSADPDSSRNWRINNPNPFAVEVSWELVYTEQQGSFLAPPGDSYLETVSQPYYNLLCIQYENPWGRPVKSMAWSPGITCSEFKSTLTEKSMDLNREPTLLLGAYPNPFVSTLNLEMYNGNENTFVVTVFTAQGAQVYHKLIKPVEGYSSTTMDLSALQKGMYILKVYSSDGQTGDTYKLIKQ